MNDHQLQAKLAELLALSHETEWVEFKHNNSDPQMIGEYLSAISNSAALESQAFGYIVWGIEDGTHTIAGTSFKPRQRKGAGNEDLEPWLNKLLAPRVNFRISEFESDGRPIVMVEVQAANTAPVAFAGRRFVRVGSHKKSLSEHPERERRLWEILSGPAADWSAAICETATLDDLHPKAIMQAREVFKVKHPNLASEVDGWNDPTFLNKAKICIDGRVTNAAIILLGKEESTHFLSPSVAQMTWVLKSKLNADKDYRHFGPPFLLAVDELFANVRNLTLRHLPDGTLFPVEVSQYDPWVLREILHNCIAHQDYSMRGRVNVVEVEDESILFTNLGRFLPGSVEEAIRRDQPQEEYRNRFLVDAMVNLNMIDTIGSGIRRAFTLQRKRYFPMPSYDLSEPGRIKVRVIGQILDPNYTRMLMSQTNLDLLDVIVLDKVQKQVPISEDELQSLRSKKLVEGRRTNLRVSADIAAATNSMVDYLNRRGIDKDYCQRMVVELLQKLSEASRPEIESLLLSKLSDSLDDAQKRNFVRNLLQEMRRDKVIQPIEGKRGRGAKWELSKPRANDDG